MRNVFLRTLAVTAVIQFIVTRRLAGEVIEEGRGQRMWMMYPANVILNALVWTLLLAFMGRLMSVVRHR